MRERNPPSSFFLGSSFFFLPFLLRELRTLLPLRLLVSESRDLFDFALGALYVKDLRNLSLLFNTLGDSFVKDLTDFNDFWRSGEPRDFSDFRELDKAFAVDFFILLLSECFVLSSEFTGLLFFIDFAAESSLLFAAYGPPIVDIVPNSTPFARLVFSNPLNSDFLTAIGRLCANAAGSA